MSQVQIPNSDHYIWRARINHLCKSGLDPIDCKSSYNYFAHFWLIIFSEQIFYIFRQVHNCTTIKHNWLNLNHIYNKWMLLLSPLSVVSLVLMFASLHEIQPDMRKCKCFHHAVIMSISIWSWGFTIPFSWYQTSWYIIFLFWHFGWLKMSSVSS